MVRNYILLALFLNVFLLLDGCLENHQPQKTHENQSQDFINNGRAKNRYEVDYQDQLVLRRALSQLPPFYGDGQIRWYSGGWNGSIFLFSDSTLMTNEHVVDKRTINQLEYIIFPHIVIYRRDLYQRVKAYEEERLKRLKSDYGQAKTILKNRITFLENKASKTKEVASYLRAYKDDLEFLNNHPPIEMKDREFISVEDAIKDIWSPNYNQAPDMAFIVLKKPLRQLITNPAIKNLLSDDYFATKNMYNPKKQGRVFDGTPLYIAGYGRELNGSVTDKNKSLKAFKSWAWNMPEILGWEILPSPITDYEKDYYYFEKGSEPGDSGSRIWAQLNPDNSLSYEPHSLSAKKIAVGINSNGGGGTYFSKNSLEQLFQQFSLMHPDIVRQEFSSIQLEPLIPTKPSKSIVLLFNFAPSTDPLFKKKIRIYYIFKYFLAQHFLRDYGRTRLLEMLSESSWWFTRNDKVLGQPNPINGKFYSYFGQGSKLLEKAATIGVKETLGAYSPSDLTQSQWFSLLKSAYDLPQTEEALIDRLFNVVLDKKEQTQENKIKLKTFAQTILKEEKAILEKLINDTFLDDYKQNYSIRLANLSKEVSLKDYLSAITTWIEKNAATADYALVIPEFNMIDSQTYNSLDDILRLDF